MLGNDAGISIGLLNSAQVIAQMVANFCCSIVMALTGSVSWGIAVGGEFALVACVVVWTLILPGTPAFARAMGISPESRKLLGSSDEEEEEGVEAVEAAFTSAI